MNYITSCPNCDTHFTLSKEHIKSYRGKVQCGNCEQVFNAKNRLTEISDEIHNEEEYLASLEKDIIVEETTTEYTENQEEAAITDDIELSLETNEAAYISDIPATETFHETQTIAIEDEDSIIEPAFLQKERTDKKSSVWLSALSFILLIGAILQSIYFMRVKIAAEYPQLKPLLLQTCAQLNCEIDLPRNLNVISINDSDMQESDDYESVINFSSVIINNAKYAQAYPIIKLTLTNADDKAVIKKLILPKNYIKNANTIKNGFAPAKELPIKLTIKIENTPVVGYRVQLLY